MIEVNTMVFGLAEIKLIEYFVDSNFAGKVVIAFLVVMNCYAMTLMWTKYQELKKALSYNARDEKRLNDLPSIYDYDDALFPYVFDKLPLVGLSIIYSIPMPTP